MIYSNKKRNVAPGVYNPRRLKELPIPTIDAVPDRSNAMNVLFDNEVPAQNEPAQEDTNAGNQAAEIVQANEIDQQVVTISTPASGSSNSTHYSQAHSPTSYLSIENDANQEDGMNQYVDQYTGLNFETSYDDPSNEYDDFDGYDPSDDPLETRSNPEEHAGTDVKSEIIPIRRISYTNYDDVSYLLDESERERSYEPQNEPAIAITSRGTSQSIATTQSETIVIDADTNESMTFLKFPIPKIMHIDSRMKKQEDDDISGEKPFFETVSTFFISFNTPGLKPVRRSLNKTVVRAMSAFECDVYGCVFLFCVISKSLLKSSHHMITFGNFIPK